MERRKPLKPGAPLARRSSLRQSGPLRRVLLKREAPVEGNPPRPERSATQKRARPAPVPPEERRARKIVKARSGGLCEGCTQRPATDWSHRIGAGVGGKWCPSNGLHLCRRCHRWLHDNPAAARDELGWRLRSTDDPLTFPVLHAVHGWVLLDADGGWLPAEPLGEVAA